MSHSPVPAAPLRTAALLAAAAGMSLSLVAVSASARDAPADAASTNERVNQVIVYGDDPCPRSDSGDEITVCARKAENERYRIPAPLRGFDQPANRAWTDRVLAYESVGNTGTLSCTPVGPGGYTGCAQKFINNAYAEKKNGTDVRFGDMIAAERAKRLSTIDQDAATEQSRVEQAERDYEARQRANDDASNAPRPDTTNRPAPAPGN